MTSKMSIVSILRSGTSIFESKKQQWPNPELSIGRKCDPIGRLLCWTVTGPALLIFQELSLSIKEVLDKRQEDIEQGVQKPQTVSFHMLMIGSEPSKAEPTIIFTSKNQRQRRYASALIKQEKFMDGYSGIKFKTLSNMPAVHRSGPFTSAPCSERESNDGVYLVKRLNSACGALVSYGGSRLATLGGIILIKGVPYGIATQHPRFHEHETLEKPVTQGEVLAFDEDLNFDEDELAEITSRGNSILMGCDFKETLANAWKFEQKASPPNLTLRRA